MPPSRRRPTPAPRPRVAGLRRPEHGPEHDEPDTVVSAAPGSTEPAETAARPAPEDATTPQDTADAPDAVEEAPDATTDVPADALAAERRRQRQARRTARTSGPSAGEDRPAVLAFAARNTLAIVFLVIALVLAAVAVFFRGQYAELTDGNAASNRALTDSTGTRQVIDRVTEALQTSMAYDPAAPAASESAANTYLTGEAGQWWRCTFTGFRTDAARDKRTARVTVLDIGVTVLQGDRADVLVSLVLSYNPPLGDQKVTVSYLQLKAGAVRQDGEWKIDHLGTTTKLPRSNC